MDRAWFPKAARIHFAQTFVARDGEALTAMFQHRIDEADGPARVVILSLIANLAGA